MTQREIKFRGKDIAGKWHHGNICITTTDFNGVKAGTYISNSVGRPFAYHVRPETVGQFIGRLDKHNKPIYEGDICQDDYGNPCHIEWVHEHCQFMAVFGENAMEQYQEIGKWCEAVGNIHEPIELRG